MGTQLRDQRVTKTDDRTATIASGAFLSSAVNVAGMTVFGIFFPTMTQTSFKIVVGDDAGNFNHTLYEGEIATPADYSVGCGTNKYVPLKPYYLRGVNNLKIQMAGNEGGDRTITLRCMPL